MGRFRCRETGVPRADRPPGALLVLGLVQGALSFALGGTLITWVLYEVAGAPTMAGSYATAALNAATVGPLAAGTTLGTGAGDLGPLWSSGLLVALHRRDVLTPVIPVIPVTPVPGGEARR